jgi:hypothetical protein
MIRNGSRKFSHGLGLFPKPTNKTGRRRRQETVLPASRERAKYSEKEVLDHASFYPA